MKTLIIDLMANFTLTLLLTGFLATILSLLFKLKHLSKALIIDTTFSYFLFFSIGLSYFFNFIMHVFFGDMTAHFIGWPQSPFQAEVGYASLGFALVGSLAFWSNWSFRAATIIAPAFFLWGAAIGHLYQIIINANYAPGNAGTILWTDILIPIIGFTLLYLQYRYPPVASSNPPQ